MLPPFPTLHRTCILSVYPTFQHKAEPINEFTQKGNKYNYGQV